jgi:hypothetical protein
MRYKEPKLLPRKNRRGEGGADDELTRHFCPMMKGNILIFDCSVALRARRGEGFYIPRFICPFFCYIPPRFASVAESVDARESKLTHSGSI